LPYIVAEVEPDLRDETPENLEESMKLEKEVYDNLKYYMRLMRTFNPNKDVVISMKAKKYAPSTLADKSDNGRRTNFSFSLGKQQLFSYIISTSELFRSTRHYGSVAYKFFYFEAIISPYLYLSIAPHTNTHTHTHTHSLSLYIYIYLSFYLSHTHSYTISLSLSLSLSKIRILRIIFSQYDSNG
jgi:hypothetical protein